MADQSISTMADDAPYSQEARFLKLDSPLGAENVLLTEIKGKDAISEPFLFEIEFATLLPSARVRKLLAHPVTLWPCNALEIDRRPVNGLVAKLSGPFPGPRGFRLWRAEIVPRLAFLNYTADCRIFQNMTVPDILREIFTQNRLDDFELRGLMGQYPALDYCVQYRETALAFVSRLMEHVGLFYWHEHDESSHRLVITDQNRVAHPALGAPVRMQGETGFPDVDTLTSDYAFRPGKWTLTDYDFRSPTQSLIADTPIMQSEPAMTDYEIFDFPGKYTDPAEGAALTRLRIEYEEVQFQRLRGTGRRAKFDAGRTIELEEHDAETIDVHGKLLLTEVRHFAVDQSHLAQSREPARYWNEFVAHPASRPFRPERKTPKPFVHGVQTAIVTGPPGETIYTDEHGRVKVRFFWDRNPSGNPDENRSCWLRVSQAWADGKFGGVHLPRIGQEVIVDFLEGDPDRPIITGRVYNGDNMHPYDLPANKTQSGMKSQSVPSGGSNEWRFEDKQGQEELYMHSQRDHRHEIGNDHNHNVGHDHNHGVGHNYNITINNDYNVTTSNNYTTTTTATESTTSAVSKKVTGVQAEVIGLNNEVIGMSTEMFGIKNEITGAAFTLAGEEFSVKLLTQDFGLSKYTNYISGTNVYTNYCNEYVLKFDNCILKIDIADFKMENTPIKEELKNVHFANAQVKIGNDVTEMKQNSAFLRDSALVLIQ
jgi:type VI secretion system secreted protein VgrG